MFNELKANVFSVKKFAVHDGPGIRTTVFLSGCPLHCPWCHNPESQGEYDIGSADNFRNIDELIKIIEKDRAFYDESGGGVTISGGEPLVQYNFLLKFLQRLQNIDIQTALDTTGFIDTEKFRTIASFTDLFLYDIKIMDEEKHKKFTGVLNRIIKKNFEYLSEINKRVWVRFPLIPNFTDDEENIRAIGDYIKKMSNVERVSVLSYHSLGSHKYEKLGREWTMKGIKTPSDVRIQNICSIFEEYGINAVKGG